MEVGDLMDYEEQLSAAKLRAERDQARQDACVAKVKLGRAMKELGEAKRKAGVHGKVISDQSQRIHELKAELGRTRAELSDLRLEMEHDAPRLMPEGCEAHGMVGTMLEYRRVLNGVCKRLGLTDGTGKPEQDGVIYGELEKRLMPGGMEWPKYTDGELVRIGGCWEGDGLDTSTTYIERIIFAEDGVYLDNDYSEAFYRRGERVKRAEPKVLDADGAEIRVGDTVWATNGHGPFEVTRIVCADLLRVICDDEKNGHLNVFPENLTHRAPVLAADGKLLREGETVWEVVTGDGYVVERIYSGTTEPDFPGHTVACRRPDDIVTHMFKPSQLTHERPVLDADGVPIKGGDTIYSDGYKEGLIVDGYQHDGSLIAHTRDGNHAVILDPRHFTHTKPEIDTWERIEEDASKNPFDYCKDVGHRLDTCENSEAYKAQDLVRRAKKLAER